MTSETADHRPWQEPDLVELVRAIADCHQILLGTPLAPGPGVGCGSGARSGHGAAASAGAGPGPDTAAMADLGSGPDPAAMAEQLYNAKFALLAHDGGADPVFVYANRTAQRLWRLSWGEFVGLPSRLSAEPDARAVRAAMLARVDRDGYVDDYAGVRVDSRGQRFRIEGACIWNVEHRGARLGQAARIDRWTALE